MFENHFHNFVLLYKAELHLVPVTQSWLKVEAASKVLAFILRAIDGIEGFPVVFKITDCSVENGWEESKMGSGGNSNSQITIVGHYYS